MKTILHYPQLDTIMMVEDFIREHSGEYKKKSLWQNLPKKMMYQTFCLIFDYIKHSGKIVIDRKRRIGWIWAPELARYYLNRKDLQWKPEKSPVKPENNI